MKLSVLPFLALLLTLKPERGPVKAQEQVPARVQTPRAERQPGLREQAVQPVFPKEREPQGQKPMLLEAPVPGSVMPEQKPKARLPE